MKVLIVDDSPMIRERVIALLKKHSEIEVIGESDDIAEALSMVYKLKPDILILDIKMPMGNGFYLLEYVKKYNLVQTVMILTNYADSSSKNQSVILGADYFFDKSTEFEHVPQTILSLIKTKSSPN